MKVPSPKLGGAMAQDKVFACEECTEEFVVAGRLYARLDWVLSCPCCGSTSLRLIADEVPEAVAVEAA
jgi:Zn finger protein HypA/HybF involved in hydrogenase expression